MEFFKSAETQTKSGFDLLKAYPVEELYRLVVDGTKQKEGLGWFVYEQHEPGCLKAFFAALSLISLDDGRPLCTQYIQLINSVVGGHRKPNTYSTPAGKFREITPKNITGFLPLDQSNASINGIFEFLNRLENENTDKIETYGIGLYVKKTEGNEFVIITKDNLSEIKNEFKMASNKELAEFIHTSLNSEGQFAQLLNQIKENEHPAILNKRFSNYYSAVEKANNLDDKLRLMIELVQRCIQEVPFDTVNTNTRTFILCLMRLIMQNNGIIPTFFNPEVFYLHSLDEIFDIVKKAMTVTKDVCRGEQVYGFDTNTLTKTMKEQFKGIVVPFTSMPTTNSAFTNSALYFFHFFNEAVKPAFDITKDEPTLYPESKHMMFINSLFQNFVEVKNAEGVSSLSKLIHNAIDELPDVWDVPDEVKPYKSFHSIMRTLGSMLQMDEQNVSPPSPM